MNNFFQQLIQQFRDVWGRFNNTQRILLVAIPSLILVLLLSLVAVSSRSKYEILYSHLSQKDAADVTAELKKQNIPYHLATQDDTVVILVPSDKVYDSRLTLAGEGLPKGNGVGYEIFDQTKWGTTDFTQKVNYKRALEGELQRTIESLQQIDSARVNIVIPEPELFTEQEKPTTASVVLQLKADEQLKKEQVRGIVHLVAASVEGLKPENVNVIDGHGNILSNFIQEEAEENNPDSATDGTNLTQQAKLTLHQMEVQQNFEKDLERKITTVLTKVLGNDRLAVSVSAELDFDKAENDSEIFEPVVDGQGIARSSQTKKEQYVGDAGYPSNVVGGVPGTDSNIPGYQAVVGNGTNSQYSREENTTNYEINRTVKHDVVAPGSPKRISVGVFVDNLQPQQVDAIKAGVIAAAGLDLNRGDQVEVENMPFDNSAELASLKESQMETQQNFYLSLGKIGLLVLMVLGILLFLRSLLKPKREKQYVDSPDDLELDEELPMPQVEDIISNEISPEELARAEAAREAKKREAIRMEVADMASKHPENVAQIIKKWLSEE
ncbi:MAG TPA: flagellar basal-body MS-ring/collar protein FliF [bacterium]|nr:flagellar basal-body MS-ring/collar protein FliF [bacterium]